MPLYRIRDARVTDVETLVAFTMREGLEAEGAALSVDRVTHGVEAAFQEHPAARYWVVEDGDGAAVASTSVVTEWSNFHGGHYWWIQSLFIVPEHRGQGLVETILNHVSSAAGAAGALDLRLYVHRDNERALAAYIRCGFTPSPYAILSRRPDPGKDP